MTTCSLQSPFAHSHTKSPNPWLMYLSRSLTSRNSDCSSAAPSGSVGPTGTPIFGAPRLPVVDIWRSRGSPLRSPPEEHYSTARGGGGPGSLSVALFDSIATFSDCGRQVRPRVALEPVLGQAEISAGTDGAPSYATET